MAAYLLAIDQGTTSSRAVLFNLQGQPQASVSETFEQHFPNNGWVEHNPEDLWASVLRCCQQVLAKQQITAAQVKALGITNQRETTLVWHKSTGKPLYPAIVWQDRRTSDYCQQLLTPRLADSISNKTGLLLDPYFSASKIRWILDNVPGAQQQAERGELAFGTVDSFLLWHLTAGQVHRTDATNASRTLLFNIHNQQWDPELLEIFGIPASMLPEVMDSAAAFGETDAALFGQPIVIGGMAGDQQAALIGQACFEPGMAKSTYGTGCFLMLNTGEKPLKSANKLLTTIAYRLEGKVTYAIEGSIFMAGATMQWIVEGLKLLRNAGESEAMVQHVPHDHGVFLVPSFTGLGAPYWDANARGAILGLTRDTGIDKIVAAALQSVGYQTKDLQKAMEKDGLRPNVLRVDGGMVKNNWVLAFLADILGAIVERPENTETTALGAAYLAGLHCGVFSSTTQLASLWHCERRFEPSISAEERQQLYAKWQHAVAQVRLSNNDLIS
ncbi:glycerol kinase GlpK [Rheinheimera sp. UJ63]|nr:glycerol kinase GlpK [Rheinheimera sp. UJ63]MCF4008709.1 glycerol kinase GlpK [Rheinheimera sp. UJ63]